MAGFDGDWWLSGVGAHKSRPYMGGAASTARGVGWAVAVGRGALISIFSAREKRGDRPGPLKDRAHG